MLSRDWPRSEQGEIKGRLLSENHFYDLVELLSAHGALFDCIAIDTGLHQDAEAVTQQERQARNLEAAVTEQHQPSMIADVMETSNLIRKLSIPQYLQFVAMVEVVEACLRTKTLFLAQVAPRELGRFCWRIDAKDETRTQAEDLWRKLLPMILESRSVRNPDIHLAEGDYSHFKRFLVDIPASEVKRRQVALGVTPRSDGGAKSGTNISLLMGEDMDFADSKTSVGLQLADTVTSLAARAMRASIGRRAWWHLGKLMLRPPPPQEVIRLIQLVEAARGWRSEPPYFQVLRHLKRTSLSLIAEEN
jgi:hypothetical protein